MSYYIPCPYKSVSCSFSLSYYQFYIQSFSHAVETALRQMLKEVDTDSYKQWAKISSHAVRSLVFTSIKYIVYKSHSGILHIIHKEDSLNHSKIYAL
jgi:hypothetical protein